MFSTYIYITNDMTKIGLRRNMIMILSCYILDVAVIQKTYIIQTVGSGFVILKKGKGNIKLKKSVALLHESPT